MKRPGHIDGIDPVCCGSKAEQCEDCPMKLWDDYNQKRAEYDRLKSTRGIHPEAVQHAWEDVTEAWHKILK